jgi:aminoglycoside phosphotransferase (APT) family kinase protein
VGSVSSSVSPSRATGICWKGRSRGRLACGPLGVPLAAVREYDVSDAAPLPYLVLDRLPGDDLGEVYPGLTTAQRRQIALAVADLQLAVGTLGVADGYGYSPTGRPPRRSWADVVLDNLRRSGGRLRRADASVRELHAGVGRLAQAHESALTAVPATPFLDDLTTKNVIVQAGRLTGIVDVDVVCFGDPLYTQALTKVALVARDAPTDYVDVWLERLAPDQASLKLFDLYCAVFCLDLLSEAGQMFNSDRATVVQPEQTERLSALAGELTVC